jgi:hypothetical protein
MKRKLVFFISVVVGIMIVVAPLSPAFAADPKIKVMTRNIYLGADIFKVVEAAENPDPVNYGLDVPIAVAEVWGAVQFTNFPARAEALADEIAANKPQIVGLQEVSTYYSQSPSDFFTETPTQASLLEYDFLAILMAAIEARGLEYDAFVNYNTDIEMPAFTGFDPFPNPTFDDIRMVDSDVILVKKGHAASLVYADHFDQQVGLNIGSEEAPIMVEFTRGFLAVDVDIKGTDYRFVNTHLEIRGATDSVFRIYQDWQMQELLGTIDFIQGAYGAKPLIMVGDFNSSPDDVEGTGILPHPIYGDIPIDYIPPYMQAVDAGYLDSWLLQKKYDDGLTSGFDDLVSDPFAELTSRIDLIWLAPDTLSLDKVSATVVGDEEIDMVPNPIDPENFSLWPSDHAGVVSKIKFLE